MGSTGCHLTCIVSAVATQPQVVLHCDINNHVAKKRAIGIKLLFTIRSVTEHVDLVAGTSTVPLGDAHGAAVDDSPVLLKKPSPSVHMFCAPHRCGDQVQCWVNGLYVVHQATGPPR